MITFRDIVNSQYLLIAKKINGLLLSFIRSDFFNLLSDRLANRRRNYLSFTSG